MHNTFASTGEEPLVAQLGAHHRNRVLKHLRSLSTPDLRLRFGYAITDEALQRYVRRLHFSRDALFGIFDEAAQLIALGHLGFDQGARAKTTAEFGVSVLPQMQRQGFGMRLLQRAAMHARNRGATQLMMTYVAENDALRRMALRAGMKLAHDHHEPRAFLTLQPPTATSLMDETFSEMLAAIDLGFRVANADVATHRITSA